MINKNIIVEQLTNSILASGNDYWMSKIPEFSNRNIHIAIMVEPYITKISNGEKTIESRFSQKKMLPWGKVAPGDIVIFKRSGGGFESVFEAGDVISLELTSPEDVNNIRQQYNDRLCIEDEWWDMKISSKYATLIPITHLLTIEPFFIKFKNRQSWICFENRINDNKTKTDNIRSPKEHSMDDKPIFCISGKIGSGKTTIGKLFANEINGCHGSVSDFLKAVSLQNGNATPTRDELQNLGVQFINDGWIPFAAKVLNHLRKSPKIPFVIDGVRHIKFLQAIKMLVWPTPVYEIFLYASDDTLKEHILMRGDSQFNEYHPAEGDLNVLLNNADVVLQIDGKSKEEVLTELRDKLTQTSELSDETLPIGRIKEYVDFFNSLRGWKDYHNGKDLSVSISLEASELLEIFQWRDRLQDLNPQEMQRVQEELADILIYSIDFLNAYGIDFTKIILDKLVKNAIKYPADNS